METVEREPLQVMWAGGEGAAVRVIYRKAFYTAREAATIMQVSYDTILHSIANGLLPVKRPSANRFLVAHQDMIDYLNR